MTKGTLHINNTIIAQFTGLNETKCVSRVALVSYKVEDALQIPNLACYNIYIMGSGK